MKKIICKKVYDTETATLVKKYNSGFFGDPAGYEESLYKTPGGLYFLYVCGGESSPYPEEDIKRLAKSKVSAWVDNHWSPYIHKESASAGSFFLDKYDMLKVEI